MLLHLRQPELCNLLIGLLQDILVVEPDAFLIGELGTSLRTLRDVEQGHQLVEREEFLLSTGIPSQQSQEIDDCLGEVTVLTVAAADVTRLGVVPLQREHREAQSVAIALREFSLAVGLKQQRQVSKAGHRVGPAESLVKQHM